MITKVVNNFFLDQLTEWQIVTDPGTQYVDLCIIKQMAEVQNCFCTSYMYKTSETLDSSVSKVSSL